MENVVLSSPLQQLKDEHKSLRAIMDRYYDITEEIEFHSGPAVIQLFTQLYDQVSDFSNKLKVHSIREEEGLFPMMTRCLGENDRTIEVMEVEHEKAEKHLNDFLREADLAGSSLDENDAQYITVYAVQAYTTLTQHFLKEEKIIFPLAEKILSVDNKDELERMLQNL